MKRARLGGRRHPLRAGMLIMMMTGARVKVDHETLAEHIEQYWNTAGASER